MTEETKRDLPATLPNNDIYGFEDAKTEDVIIPRLKVINALSPERQEDIAVEGSIINSLTKTQIGTDAVFIPIKVYYSNIHWDPDRNAEVRIICRSVDGKIGNDMDGANVCEQCGKNKFDNSKKGKDAQPICTAYLNFLGFMSDDFMPVVLSFARTNYMEGKKMLSIARSLRTSLWNYSYKLTGKKTGNGKNNWYIINTQLVDKTTDEQRTLAAQLYATYQDSTKLNVDLENTAATAKETTNLTDAEIDAMSKEV